MTPDARTRLRATLTELGMTIGHVNPPQPGGGRRTEHWGKWGLGLTICGDGEDVYLGHASITDPTVRAAITAVWAAIDEPGGQGNGSN